MQPTCFRCIYFESLVGILSSGGAEAKFVVVVFLVFGVASVGDCEGAKWKLSWSLGGEVGFPGRCIET